MTEVRKNQLDIYLYSSSHIGGDSQAHMITIRYRSFSQILKIRERNVKDEEEGYRGDEKKRKKEKRKNHIGA